jgi:hypothetical protein
MENGLIIPNYEEDISNLQSQINNIEEDIEEL